MAKTYKEYSPSAFDSRGLGLSERQDWLVAPVIQTRDSGTLELSNFAVVLADLGGESDTVEVHRFGHWGPGWFEIVLVHPSRLAEVEAWEGALSNYPIASDDDHSQREMERAQEYWAEMDTRERIRVCAKFRVSIFAARHDWVPSCDSGDLESYLAE